MILLHCFFSSGLCLLAFNMKKKKSYIFGKCQAEDKVQHSSAIKILNTNVFFYLKPFCFLVWLNWIIEGQLQRHFNNEIKCALNT